MRPTGFIGMKRVANAWRLTKTVPAIGLQISYELPMDLSKYFQRLFSREAVEDVGSGTSPSLDLRPRKISVEDISSEDIVIVLLGRGLVGKSSFINIATQSCEAAVNRRGLTPLTVGTPQVEYIKCTYPGDKQGRSVVFVDTPGFNMVSSYFLGRLISQGMMRAKTSITGIMLLQSTPASDAVLRQSQVALLDFLNAAGCSLPERWIVLVMTRRWGEAAQNADTERSLWKTIMNDMGLLALTLHFEGTTESAWDIVTRLLAPKREALVKSQIADIITRLEVIFKNTAQYKRFLACNRPKLQSQQLLDLFQQLLDIDTLEPHFRHNLVIATQRLANVTDLYPKCLALGDVDYIGVEPVAAGGFADIHQGRTKGRNACFKVIRLYRMSQINFVMKIFYREAILWGQLSHPNLLPFYGFHRFQSRPCLVSPWVENGDINYYLQEHPDTDRVLLASDTAAGLSYLHARDIIHGDLKGPNILVNNSGRAQLTDFGLSGVSGPTILKWSAFSSAASKGGSVRWQAPELFALEDERNTVQPETIRNSKESDMYAWACVCYEIFTGLVPFYDCAYDAGVIYRVLSRQRPSRPHPESQPWAQWGLTEAIWSLKEKCWEADPTSRPSAGTVAAQLHSVSTIDTRPVGGWETELSPGDDEQDYPSVSDLDMMLWGPPPSSSDDV